MLLCEKNVMVMLLCEKNVMVILHQFLSSGHIRANVQNKRVICDDLFALT